MGDAFSIQYDRLESPPRQLVSITPANTDLADVTKGLYVSGAGALVVRMSDDSANVTFTGVRANTYLPLRVKRVATGTTATGIIGLYGPASVSVAAPGGNPPVNTVAPTITGTPTVGQTLTLASVGTWTGDATIVFTQQWEDDGSPISGATATTYLLTGAEASGNITCDVTGTNSAGFATATSNTLGPVASVPVLASVAANGWEGTWDGTPPAVEPLTPLLPVSPSFDPATGLATTLQWENRVNCRTRVPGSQTLSATGVALHYKLIASTTLAGVTVNSTEVAPKPIVARVHRTGQLLGTGSTLRLQYTCVHYYGGKGPVLRQFCRFGVRLTNTATSATITRWTTDEVVLTPETGDQHSMFGAQFDISASDLALLGNGPIREDPIAVPWIGTNPSIFDAASFAGLLTKACASGFHLRDEIRAANVPYCHIDAQSGNNSTGTWVTSGTPLPFASKAGAELQLTDDGAGGNRYRTLPGSWLAAGQIDGCEYRVIRGAAGTGNLPLAQQVAGIRKCSGAGAVRIVRGPGFDTGTRLTIVTGQGQYRWGPRNATGSAGFVESIEGINIFWQDNVALIGAFDATDGVNDQVRFQFSDLTLNFNNQTGSLIGDRAVPEFVRNVEITGYNAANQFMRSCGSLIRGVRGSLAGGRIGASGVICATRLSGVAGISFGTTASTSNWTIHGCSFPGKTDLAQFLSFPSGTYTASQGAIINVEGDYLAADVAANAWGFVSADNESYSTSHIIMAGVSHGGFSGFGRDNYCYVGNVGGDTRTHNWNIVDGFVSPQFNHKGDSFPEGGGSALRIGGLEVDYGVGINKIVTLFAPPAAGVDGIDKIVQIDCRAVQVTGTSNSVPLQAFDSFVVAWGGSRDGTNAGVITGDYYPVVGSLLRTGDPGAAFPTAKAFLSRDIGGRARSLNLDWPGAWGANR